MFSISKKIEIAYAHRLILPYESKCSNLHGHNGIVNVIISNFDNLNNCGMLIDFVQFKKKLQKSIIDKYDHATLVSHEDAALLEYCQKTNTKYVQIFGNSTSEKIAKLIWLDVCNELINDLDFQKFVNFKNCIVYIEFNESANNQVAYTQSIDHYLETKDSENLIAKFLKKKEKNSESKAKQKFKKMIFANHLTTDLTKYTYSDSDFNNPELSNLFLIKQTINNENENEKEVDESDDKSMDSILIVINDN